MTAFGSICVTPALLPHIDDMVKEGLVTPERVQVIKYRA
ncbi:MAG: DUF190 domain-containing protein [Phycisphaerales bacterium]|nr:DUF190 domain-containing protein [Phycisphaerales bacterium]